MPRDDSPSYEPQIDAERDDCEKCDECGHGLKWHGPQGCECERGDGHNGQALGPCGCREWR
jgi:hypothetical protein